MLQVTCRSSNKGSTNLVLQKRPSRVDRPTTYLEKTHHVWVIEISKIYSYTMLYHVIPCYTMLYHVIPCYTMLYLEKIGHTVILYIYMILMMTWDVCPNFHGCLEYWLVVKACWSRFSAKNECSNQQTQLETQRGSNTLWSDGLLLPMTLHVSGCHTGLSQFWNQELAHIPMVYHHFPHSSGNFGYPSCTKTT